MAPPIVTRRASAGDLPAVLPLLRRALGWTDADTRFARWKHLENPFGPSAMWVALAGSRVVGFRAFLRWQLRDPGGRVRSAVRAVDTATDPDFQRRGVFRQLTEAAVAELTGEGVEMVFNTPNRRSLPGYLAMGWTQVGRLPAGVRPSRWRFAAIAARARRPAARGPLASSLGAPAGAALHDGPGLARLVAELPAAEGWSTRRTPEYLRWRYGDPVLGYRAVLAGPTVADGLALFRLRSRGPAVEAAIVEVLVPSAGATRGVLRTIARSRQADYLLRLQRPRVTRDGFLRLPGLGPVLVCRSLAGAPVPAIAEWALGLGDVELL